MKLVFADTSYWIALIYPRDEWFSTAQILTESFSTETRIFTSDEVLSEVLAFFGSLGPHARLHAANLATNLLNGGKVLVFAQSRESFLGGLALYQSRLDKGYSLTDCVSMQLMRREGIVEVLTHDAHFAQEGFHPLF